ncbi:putative transposase of IS4/5 family DUF4096 [Gluconacetobacter liquefaciens]|nr:putative transposase of IS4/5 family DUF4096 [Gluconacetobacter liquefaciens]
MLAAKPGGRPRKWGWRKLLDAMFYLLRGGLPWRMLPLKRDTRFGSAGHKVWNPIRGRLKGRLEASKRFD